MGACLSLSRVSDDMPAPLPCAAPPLPVKDGAHLVGAGKAAGDTDGAAGKGLSGRVRALVPAAVLPPRTGQHAYQVSLEQPLCSPAAPAQQRCICESYLGLNEPLVRQVVGELGDGCSGSYGALRLLQHRRTSELAASRWIEYAKGAPNLHRSFWADVYSL